MELRRAFRNLLPHHQSLVRHHSLFFIVGVMLQPSFTSICLGLSWLSLSVAARFPLVAERAPSPLPQLGVESLPTMATPNGDSSRPDPLAKVFNWEITWAPGAPDGNTRNLFKINGNFPGPKMELTEGDNVEVRVINQSPYNMTIHYHGKHQKPRSSRYAN